MSEGFAFQVRNQEIEALLRDLGQFLKGTLPDGWGFVLFLMSHGAGGAMFYISSIERDGALAALREFLERQQRVQ